MQAHDIVAWRYPRKNSKTLAFPELVLYAPAHVGTDLGLSLSLSISLRVCVCGICLFTNPNTPTPQEVLTRATTQRV